MRTKHVLTILFGTYSLLCATRAVLAFARRPLPKWLDWLDVIFFSMLIFPPDFQRWKIGLWSIVSIVYVTAKLAGDYGYPFVATSLLSGLGLASAIYSVYLLKRQRSIYLKDEEDMKKFIEEDEQELLGTKVAQHT